MSAKIKFELKVTRVGADGSVEGAKEFIREISEADLVRDERHPSSVFVAVMKQMLYSAFEQVGGLMDSQADRILVGWAEARKRAGGVK